METMHSETTLLVDIGTNAEIMLAKGMAGYMRHHRQLDLPLKELRLVQVLGRLMEQLKE